MTSDAPSSGPRDRGDGSGPPTRRRGAELESALLGAAWDELTSAGYGAFTMDGVAERARTSRAVLYRRWPNRPELALAAIRHHRELTAIQLPDTGSLRQDILALLRSVSESIDEVAGIISFLLADYFRETGLPAAAIRERLLAGRPAAVDTLLERAVARGEIDPAAITPRIASLPLDLVRHDLLMNRAPVPEATLVEIVDELFLPLLGAASHDA